MLQFELFCYFQTCHRVLKACLHIPQLIFFKHFPECLVFVFFLSHIAIPRSLQGTLRIIHVSVDQGETWNMAQLPAVGHEQFYSILAANEEMVFMHVDEPGGQSTQKQRPEQVPPPQRPLHFSVFRSLQTLDSVPFTCQTTGALCTQSH